MPSERPLRQCREGPFRARVSGRGERIRTFDLLNPIQVRYQTALRPDRATHYDRERRAAATPRPGSRR